MVGRTDVGDWRKPWRRPISPLVGEMSGRTEGGAKERRPMPRHSRAKQGAKRRAQTLESMPIPWSRNATVRNSRRQQRQLREIAEAPVAPTARVIEKTNPEGCELLHGIGR
ncbi:MAG: hypothetical protein E5V37_21595 [Mesorhizobium sp.]|nr:MAG: hypothetical protein E5V37_21595 [Mesorhizobium sp.]